MSIFESKEATASSISNVFGMFPGTNPNISADQLAAEVYRVIGELEAGNYEELILD